MARSGRGKGEGRLGRPFPRRYAHSEIPEIECSSGLTPKRRSDPFLVPHRLLLKLIHDHVSSAVTCTEQKFAAMIELIHVRAPYKSNTFEQVPMRKELMKHLVRDQGGVWSEALSPSSSSSLECTIMAIRHGENRRRRFFCRPQRVLPKFHSVCVRRPYMASQLQ